MRKPDALEGTVRKPNSEYTICCIQCHTTENLQMVAHHTQEGLMVGWLFVCHRCVNAIYDQNIFLAARATREKPQ